MKFFDDYNTKVSASMAEFIEVHFESRERKFTDKKAIHAAGNLRQHEGPSTRNMCM